LLCNLLQERFKAALFLENDRHSGHEVKLHCTLLNTTHLKPRPKKRYKALIDATEILESEGLKDYDFGEVDVDQVQICEMGAKQVDGEIRYRSVGGFSLSSMEETNADVVIGASDKVQEAEGADVGNAEILVVHNLEK